jgi:hypothetical protein
MPRTNKDIFMARLMRERDRFELLVNRIGFTRQLTMPHVLGKWSIKDMLANLLAHELYIADRLAEVLLNEPYVPCKTQNALDVFLDQFGYPDFGSPLLDDTSPGEWFVSKYRNVSLEELVTQEVNVFTSIMSSLEKLPEEALDRHNLYERVANNTFKRYREQNQNIRRWLAVNAANSKNS